MKDLAEVMEKTKEFSEMKEKLFDCLKAEISVKGMDCVDTKEAGEVVDMIKDLAEAEAKCMEALYYQKVVEAMTSYEEPRYDDRLGYNRNRYPSSGRYASAGHGMRMGYIEPYYPDGEMVQDINWNEPTGYSGGGNSGNRQGSTSGGNQSMGYHMPEMMYDEGDPRYGKAYNEYLKKRRFYTETKSEDDKREMDRNAEEHVQSTLVTVRDIWKNADPNLRKRMKDDFSKLLNDMNTNA